MRKCCQRTEPATVVSRRYLFDSLFHRLLYAWIYVYKDVQMKGEGDERSEEQSVEATLNPTIFPFDAFVRVLWYRCMHSPTREILCVSICRIKIENKKKYLKTSKAKENPRSIDSNWEIWYLVVSPVRAIIIMILITIIYILLLNNIYIYIYICMAHRGKTGQRG